jgi:glycine dehydrogenase subunit 1
MNFLPLTSQDRAEMLARIGCDEDALFSAVKRANPAPFAAMTEAGIMNGLAALAHPVESPRSGLGLGRYFIPAVVDAITSRGEFVTAYTPYQPECSQGTLTSIYEFQTRICQITGLDVSNAGLYDGSTAVVEAVRMALAETGRREIAIARSVAPATREVLITHFSGQDVAWREIPVDTATGEMGSLEGFVGPETAAVVVQSPNVFGVVESRIAGAFAKASSAGAVPIQIFHPVAVALFPKPSDVGAEIAVAEGQPLGIPLWGGGPYLGLIAATQKFLRRMPGRIVGKTVDAGGREAFVLTLQTREQHIRRERATSNICTNQALIALRATVYLAVVGLDGLREEAVRLHESAKRASNGLRLFSGEIFNEYATAGGDGIPLDYPEFGDVRITGVAR